MLTFEIVAAAALATALPPAGLTVLPPAELLPVGSPGYWASDLDYPREAARLKQEGDVGFTLRLGADGRPVSCEIVQSSTFKGLDNRTCALMMARARFKLAKKGQGQLDGATWASTVHWVRPRR